MIDTLERVLGIEETRTKELILPYCNNRWSTSTILLIYLRKIDVLVTNCVIRELFTVGNNN